MRPSGAAASLCVSLVLVVVSVSAAVQRLKSIHDLKNIKFGQDVPEHSLRLLHWFANEVEIDNNNVVWLTFDQNRGDYGSHHYGNFEHMLEPLPPGCRYYTVGNVHQEASVQLPDYVVNSRAENMRRNLVRIVFRVRDDRSRGRQVIDQVYITQHYEDSHAGTRYDPGRTYRISTNLLRQIREFSLQGNGRNSLAELRDDFGRNVNDWQLTNLANTWGNLARLGLLLFIVTRDKHNNNNNNNNNNNHHRQNNRPQNTTGGPTTPYTGIDVEANRENDVNTTSVFRNLISSPNRRPLLLCIFVSGLVISLIVAIVVSLTLGISGKP